MTITPKLKEEEERNRKKSGNGHNRKQSHACLMPAMADTNGSGDKSMPQQQRANKQSLAGSFVIEYKEIAKTKLLLQKNISF